jgi:subtilisin-like proprotein convertase family protein
MRRIQFFLIACLACLLEVQAAQEFTFSYEGLNTDIPELNPSGISDARTVDLDPSLILIDVNVSLTISGSGFGGFNGDLFVTLQHESGYAVLLNRPGVRDGFPSGYSDTSGLSVTFDDAAPADVHSYRLTLNGSESIPISGPLVGSWSPDARDVDPLTVSQSSPRTAFLDSFDGHAAKGEWTLFLSDRSAGGTHQLKSWELNIQTIPEPSTNALASIFGLILLFKAAFQKKR